MVRYKLFIIFRLEVVVLKISKIIIRLFQDSNNVKLGPLQNFFPIVNLQVKN